MIFSVFPELCNHHHDLILEHFYQSKTSCSLTVTLHSQLQPQATNNQLPVSIDLLLLNITLKYK